MNTCIFCGPTRVKLTAEHIYSDWISRRLRRLGIELYQAAEIRKEQRHTYKTGSIELKIRVVCERCNNNWLADIERKFLASFFFDMVRGKPTRLPIERQITLVAWLIRLAMVYEFRDIGPTDATFFSQAERERFRSEMTFPTATWVWLAAYKGPRVSVGQHHLYLSEDRNLGDCIQVTTGTLGRFAFQVWSRRWPKLLPSDRQIARALRPVVRPWMNATIRLWPHQRDNLAWPPPNLADDSLKLFCDRFGGNTVF